MMKLKMNYKEFLITNKKNLNAGRKFFYVIMDFSIL